MCLTLLIHPGFIYFYFYLYVLFSILECIVQSLEKVKGDVSRIWDSTGFMLYVSYYDSFEFSILKMQFQIIYFWQFGLNFIYEIAMQNAPYSMYFF